MNNFSILFPILSDALIGAIMASAYAGVFYFKKRSRKDKSARTELFNRTKFFSTVLVGVAVGACMGLMGVDPTQGNVEQSLATYVGAIALVESVLKTAWRRAQTPN